MIVSSTENFPDQCSWEGPVKGGYLHGYDTETLRDMSVESCKSACESSCYYRCVSFDYVPSSRICYLSMSNRYTAKLSTNANYEYYERNCNRKLDLVNQHILINGKGPLQPHPRSLPVCVLTPKTQLVPLSDEHGRMPRGRPV